MNIALKSADILTVYQVIKSGTVLCTYHNKDAAETSAAQLGGGVFPMAALETTDGRVIVIQAHDLFTVSG